MLKIDMLLDDQKGFDPLEPAGTLLFYKGEEEIRTEYACLDVWLISMIKGILEAPEGENLEIELVDQAEPFLISFEDEKCVLQYFDEQIHLNGLTELKNALIEIVKELLKRSMVHEVASQNDFLMELKNFVEAETW